MGILVIGMLLGWVLASVALGFLVTWLISITDFIPAGKIGALRLILTIVIVASPFLYWSVPIYIFGGLWAEECEKSTGYIFHSSPPLDFVSGPGSRSSWAADSWMYLADTDIRSLVANDKQGLGLTGEAGSFVLRLAEANDPKCALFYENVARLKRKTPYLRGRCIAVEPLDSTAEVLKLEAKLGDVYILREWGPFKIRESRRLLQNSDSKEVYAEYVHVSYHHPKFPPNFFAIFSFKPSCKKLDALKKHNMGAGARLFDFAFSARLRAEIEDLSSAMQ